MKIVNPGFVIEDELDGYAILKKIEKAGRVCYKSEEKIKDDSAEHFVRFLIKRGHESVLEHFSFSVRFIVDRGVSHELVRHRVGSFSQESTRYCNYGGKDIEFIKPPFFLGDSYVAWMESCRNSEKIYKELVVMGAKPEEARTVLNQSLKTEIVVTMDLRGWRNFFKLRVPFTAHPQMREVCIPLLFALKKQIPVVFDDVWMEVDHGYKNV